jgi:CheY-like chemotaxis protein
LESKGYVLVVDDDADARNILAMIIGNLGMEYDTAEDGHIALEKILARRPALILLDLMMPRMTGFDVLTHLRSTPDTRGIPVIVVSAAGDLHLLQLPGVSSVISKAGMRVADVRDRISNILDNKTPNTDVSTTSQLHTVV